jgi:hypothetical protein
MEGAMSAPRWLTGLRIIRKTVLRTFSTLERQQLGMFAPFVGLLLLLAGVLWLINAIAPLAPFVYSLF